jgi:hypothetical protein
MKTPDSEIRKYLQTLTVGAPVLDRVGVKQTYPYVHIQDITVTDFTTADQNLWDCEVLLDVVTANDGKQGSRKPSDTISAALLTAFLDTRPIDLGDFLIVSAELIGTNYIDEAVPPLFIIRKLVRISITVEETI